MSLVPHKIVALNELNEGAKNTIAGAVVSLFDSTGSAVTLFDDEAGNNGSTTKQTDSEGVVVVYVTPGEYSEQVNGGIQRKVLVGSKEITTEQLISRVRKAQDGDVLTTTGFSVAGDAGGAQWKATSTTGLTPSQTPADRGAAELVDGSGRLWVLISLPATKRKSYSALALGIVGDGIADDTDSLRAGLANGDICGNDIFCRITSRIEVSSAQRGLIGNISILADTTTFNRTDGIYDESNGSALLVTGDDWLMDGARVSTTGAISNDNTTCAMVLRGIEFSVTNCEFDRFARTKVVRIETCSSGSKFNYNHIYDCEMGGVTTSQLTGIDIDDNRLGGIPSENIEIKGNLIENLTVTSAFEASFGYQTDGINISHPTSSGHKITANTIKFTGEAIDCFGAECEISKNHIYDSYVSGIKLVNGATDCMVLNNHIIRPRTYGVVVAGSANVGTPTSGNRIENNHVVSVNANSDSPTTSFAFGAEDNTGASLPFDNTFKNNTTRDCGNADRIIFNDATPNSNEFIDTKVIGSTPATIVSNGSGAVITFQDKAYVKAYPTAQDISSLGAFLNLSNVIENRYGELSSGVYTARVPRTVSVSGSIRTGAANAGRTWSVDLIKNGSPIERAQVVVSLSGDLVIRISAPSVTLDEGDELGVFVSHNELASTVITSSSLYSFTISEL